MRRISANFLFDGRGRIIKNPIVEVDHNGYITNILSKQLQERSNTEFYNGVLVPGFINTHSHIELAYLKNQIKPKNLPDFISQIIQLKKNSRTPIETINEKVQLADRQMFNNGIVAVGDVSNTDISADIKNSSKIFYHTFIEIFDDFNELKAQANIQKAKELYKKFSRASIVCHSPYSCSLEFISRIIQMMTNENIFSIHSQETQAENQMYIDGTGDMIHLLDRYVKQYRFVPTGRSSLFSYLPLLPKDKNVILVHNIYTTDQEIAKIMHYSDKIYLSFCPKSNMYIEKQLPAFHKFKSIWNRCTIGTDSLASNDTLDILQEMKLINIPFSEKIKWATFNGAKALNISDMYGSIEIGKRPGINLITPFDFENMELLPNSKVKRLV